VQPDDPHRRTIVVMEQFDPEQYLALVETYRVTHSQLVPTMFSRC
jgi:long-chain acyl-CoA synthetase